MGKLFLKYLDIKDKSTYHTPMTLALREGPSDL